MGIFGNFFGGSKDKTPSSSVGGGRGSSAYAEKPGERANAFKSTPVTFNATTHNDNSRSSNYIKERDTAAAARASGDAAAIAAVQPEVIRGAAPEGIKNLMGYTNPVGIMGKLAGWVNGLDPTKQKHSVIGGRQLYKNKETDFTYSYNFLGLPYEVKIRPNGSVVDALKIDAAGKVPGDMGYNKETNGYAIQAQKAEANGDNDTARQIRQEEADNSNPGGGSDGDTDRPSAEQIKDMATAAGVIKNIADMEAIIKDPTKFLDDRGMTLADLMSSMDANAEGTNLDASNPAYGLGDDPSFTASTTGDAATVDTAEKPDVATYDAATSTLTDKELAVGVTGEVSDDATVNAEDFTIDTTGAATGINEDGTTSVLGNALNDFASQDISKVIDTSTVAGKLLAQKLGEGNYTDSKATVLGQMKLISAEFKSSTGEPIIPAWAQSMHRDASKSIAFSGISGTAATAAFSNAIMEATLGVAEKDATFFQTLTTKNLDNRQQAIINKANVLSKLELANMDVRSQAAVLNAKNFMEMQNLSNEQQAEIVNKQAFVQSLFDNTKAINAQRLFTADNTNDINKFYSELNSAIQRHNTSETNALSKFNVGEINNAAQFNADIKNDRQKFLSEMQYNIDVANAKWRQTVETTNTAIMVEAHTTDVKNALDLTQEAQNNLWDSADNLLDYIWKTTDNDTERELRLLVAQLQAQSGQKSGGGFLDGLFKLGGAYLGSSSGSSWLTGVMTG
jgi:hypothetical protein